MIQKSVTTRLEQPLNGDVVISVKNISKKFCKNLKRSLTYGIVDLSKNIFGIKPNSPELRRDEFWAIDDISFELKKGEILGIIGVNGSGKSTLLRVLAGIFPPDKGVISIKGQIGALIAVGAGFHPYMTGRENIYLNGTILGMSRQEIEEKVEDIIAFAEISDFIDAPVTTYSSGMRVRLGFSIAVHRVPEVLLIDEVLSVGDISFKKKCMDMMESIKKRSSIVFISHNMYQIERICDRTILLQKGKIFSEGDSEAVISTYYNITLVSDKKHTKDIVYFQTTDDITDLIISVQNAEGEKQNSFECNDDIIIQITFNSKHDIVGFIIGLDLLNSEGIRVGNVKNIHQKSFNQEKNIIRKGHNNISVLIKDLPLLPENYRIGIKLKRADNAQLLEAIDKGFTVKSSPSIISRDGIVKMDSEWSIKQ
jgi:lipopolysaccharide transport system ATP-binding protein